MKKSGGFRANYVGIPLIVAAIAGLGGMVTAGNMEWYDALQQPVFVPPDATFGIVWTVLYVMIAVAALFVANGVTNAKERRYLLVLFAVNGAANLGWSIIHFGFQSLTGGLLEIVVLWLSTLLLVVKTWQSARPAAVLLLPYLVWVSFATFLMYKFWEINPLVR